MQVPIDNKRGLDPHMTFCPRCGNESDKITIGVIMEGTLQDGRKVYANRGQTSKTVKQLKKQGINQHITWEEITDPYKKIPATQPCEKCLAEISEHKKIVSDGGVYWRCIQCNLHGVIKAGEFARAVRETHKLTNNEPCGVEFQSCKEHG